MYIYDYVWLGGNNEFRTKSRVLNLDDNNIDNIPKWNYDGSSTGQATGTDSEITLKPCAIYKSPYMEDIPRYIVLCSTFDKDNKPLPNNHRVWADSIFKKYKDKKPWYGLEQEYFLYDVKTNKILGYEENKKQGQFYCGVGSLNAFGRKLVDKHMLYCLKAGINISGINAEVAPGQWEFQVGPCEGIEAADQLLVARFLLELISEEFNIVILWNPKPLIGNWNGSGCHTNFSTINMRQDNGIKYIEDAIHKLSLKHKEHIQCYGSNQDRLTGDHETSSIETFTVGRANRGASVRIGNETIQNKKGYFEDRRPSSDCDPYLVTAKILETISK